MGRTFTRFLDEDPGESRVVSNCPRRVVARCAREVQRAAYRGSPRAHALRSPRMPPVITALYGALNALLNIWLANRVSTLRRTHGVSLGTGKDEQKALQIAIRAHGNNAEFMPLGVMMLLLAELCGGHPVALHVMGGLLLLGRVAHPIGLPRRAPNPYRFGGTAITWGTIVAMAGYTLYLRFSITS
jgi:uncharacterized membrane protein YecN with MAPEG domain